MGTFLFSTIPDQILHVWQNGALVASEWRPLHCAVPRCWSVHHVSFPSLNMKTSIIPKPALSIHFLMCIHVLKKCHDTTEHPLANICLLVQSGRYEISSKSGNKPCKLSGPLHFLARAVTFMN